jgi:hypothetical protein
MEGFKMEGHKIGEHKLKLEGYELEDEHFISRADKVHVSSVKPFGKLESDKITKLTPLRKD